MKMDYPEIRTGFHPEFPEEFELIVSIGHLFLQERIFLIKEDPRKSAQVGLPGRFSSKPGWLSHVKNPGDS